jgi:hypothetical protein
MTNAMATTTQILSKKEVALTTEGTSPAAVEPDLQKQPHHYPAEVSVEADHEQISRLAHSHWLNREPGEGSSDEDWFRAERELRGRNSVR